MSKPEFLYNDEFWKILNELDTLEADCSLSSFMERLDCSKIEVQRAVIFLSQLSCPISVIDKEGEKWIEKTGESPFIDIRFSLQEWISLQAYFPLIAENAENPFYQILSSKLAQVEAQYKQHDLFSTAESLPLVQKFSDKSLVSLFNEFIPVIEESILKQNVLNVSVNKKTINFFPHRLVHLEGKLRLVGEDTNDHALITLDLDFVENVLPSIMDYKVNYTLIEVNEFISGFREVSGNEVRLILKILGSGEDLDLSPSYHFLADPYITTTLTGETIWAASIEPCADLIAWLADLDNSVEILDPLEIKEQVEEYLAWSKKSRAA